MAWRRVAQLVTLANAIVAVLPAGGLFFWAYGRYDGMFRDNVVFLYFMGGLLMGGFLGFLSLLSLESFVASPLVAVLLLALLFPISVTIGINRRKWQGERHAVFNGGAFGLGIAVMVSFSFLYRVYSVFSWGRIAQGVVVALGFAGLFFGLGLLAGNSVRLRKPLRFAFMGSAIVLAPIVFVEEFYRQQAWLFPVLLAAYGLTFGILAERRLLIQGVAEDARKERRRLLRQTRGS